MKSLSLFICTLILTTSLTAISCADELDEQARKIITSSGVRGGVVVHLGCGDGTLTAKLRAGDAYIVHGLDSSKQNVDTAREHISSIGLYGNISIDSVDGTHLPYAENIVNLLIQESSESTFSKDEIMRVLVPGGAAIIGGKKVVKPVPSDIDSWSHWRQGPENNPVAEDNRVGPPRHMQWAAGPRWLRSHETPAGITSMVTAGGRIFYTLDEGPIGITEGRLPEKWALIARDAFNGKLLWKLPLPNWGWQTWRSDLKQRKAMDWTRMRGLRVANPKDYPFRMVAGDQRLYFTLGHGAPVSIIDAATGKVLATCQDSSNLRKLLLSNGILVVLTGDNILAFDSTNGKPAWTRNGVKPSSIAARGDRLVYRTEKELLCISIKTGDQTWEAKPTLFGDLLISGDVVLCAEGTQMQTFDLGNGKKQWDSSKGKGGKRRGKHEGLYIIDDTIWVGYRGNRYDLKTGKKLPSLEVDGLWSPQHHHRCYSNKATSRYIIGAMEGMEFLSVNGDEHSRNNWVRGVCRLGIMPANGMSYVPTDQCFCSAGVKILGFTALTAAIDFPAVKPPEARLQKGPAFRTESEKGRTTTAAPSQEDWRAFRHDARRHGSSSTHVPANLKRAWQLAFNTRVTQPVVAGNTLYVAESDAHTVHAIDAGTGKKLWSYIAGGRIDSPPSIVGEAGSNDALCIFGSRDGYVYCLRASDGELAWRFRAAPNQRLIGSFDQLESAWPLHGSPLMLDGLVYVSAGRSTYLDGGIFLYAIEPYTGKVIHQHQELGPYEDHTKGHGHSFWSEGSRNDVLVTDGESIYIMQLRFSKELRPQPAETASRLGDRKLGRRVFSTAGFLDDEWYNRTFWMHSNIWPGFYLANQAPKSGQLLVVGDENTYGVKVFWTRNRHSPMFFPSTKGYLLFADNNDNEPILVGRDKAEAIEWLPEFDLTRGSKPGDGKAPPTLGSAPQSNKVNAQTLNKDKGVGFTRAKPPVWATWVPVRIRAMVKTSDKLFIAGPPDIFDENDADPLAALEGRKGGLLWAVSAKDGSKLAEYDLDFPPAFDGMIAARGSIYISDIKGSLSCWRP